MMRLSHHLNGLPENTKSMLRRAPGGGLLVLDSAADVGFLTEYRQANPDVDILFRATFMDERLDNWAWRMDTLCNRAEPIRHLLTGILTPWNECWQDYLDQTRQYGEATGRAADVLHQRGYANVIGGSFSTTKPKLEWWPEWLRYGGSECDGYALHEYARSERDPGGMLHYRDVWDATPIKDRRPLYITEAGIDSDTGKGWLDRIDRADYKLLMEAYLLDAWNAGYIKNAFLYQTGAFDLKWASWEYAGVTDIENLCRQGQIRKEIIMPESSDPWAGVGPGVRAAMEAQGDVPATVECWTGKEFSQTFAVSGALYAYNPTMGVRRFPPS